MRHPPGARTTGGPATGNPVTHLKQRVPGANALPALQGRQGALGHQGKTGRWRGPMALPRIEARMHPRGMDDIAQDILVGYDGSSDADLALQWAAQTALLDDRSVTVAIIDDFGATLPVVTWPEDYWIKLEEQAAEILAAAGVRDGKVRRMRGRLTPTMIALAHEASLLVLGSRGHSRAGELFVGSVSQHLSGHAPCPVVVVRPPQAPDSGRIVVGLDGSAASEDALEFACLRAKMTAEMLTGTAQWQPVRADNGGACRDRGAGRRQ